MDCHQYHQLWSGLHVNFSPIRPSGFREEAVNVKHWGAYKDDHKDRCFGPDQLKTGLDN